MNTHAGLNVSRRQFLTTAALGMAAVPVARRAVAQQDPKNVPPSEKIRLGLIGCGGIAEADLSCFLLNPEVDCPIVCDVDDSHAARMAGLVEARRGRKPEMVRDFRKVIDRKDIDVVLVCTPDHWHALPTILACQAGKDVYVEKPLGKSIHEGRAMLEAARRHNRVVQMGTQWRSGEHYRDAIEYVHSGRLGKIRMVRAWAYL
ncbi:MAG TPA: Gfo/Idh/MocA family oxidoreductase, partial [Candidatus Hydrogenedentes bacterium]|nr:Gfo/Idh/MocA family oxidoreductase [Candidatus Hydrogenedentota bacterium]